MQVNLTVRQVLETEGFRGSRVLAGRAGFDRKVMRITVAELPDAVNWLKGEELVCSTVYYLKDNPEAQKDWIVGMAKCNVSAVAIKPERFIGKVSEEVIDLAEHYQLPLIELPFSVNWQTVINGVMSTMLEIQAHRLQQSYQIHERLTKLVLTSKGLNFILKTISELVKNPVILEDRFFNLITQAAPHGLSKHDAITERLSKETTERLKKHPFFIKKQKSFLKDSFPTKNGPVEQLTLPITAGRNFFGWLTTLLINKSEEPMDRIALEHGCTVLALELLKEKASLEALARAKTDLLRGILEDDYLSDQEMQKKANLLGINIAIPTLLLIIRLNSQISSRSYLKLEDLVILKDANASIIERTQDIVIFFHPKGDSEQEPAIAEASNLANLIVSLLKDEGYGCTIGIGRCYKGLREIKKSYYEAKQAVLAAYNNGSTILTFPELGLIRLLSLISDQRELQGFCQDTLGKLINYDKKHKTSLLDTLGCYLLSGCNQAESARQLYLHVNSLNYRLQRIEEILGINLDDAETRLVLHLAIKIMQENNQLGTGNRTIPPDVSVSNDEGKADFK